VYDRELSTRIGIGKEPDHYNFYHNLEGGAITMIFGYETSFIVGEVLIILFYYMNLVSDYH
jgi:hypothetical protein